MRSWIRTVLVLAAFVLVPSAAHAQTPLAGVLVELLLNDIVLAPPASGINHSAHFLSGQTQQEAAFIFNQEIATQLATFPTGSSSGGFSFLRDPDTGRITRASNSFGPSFSDRALTMGRGWIALGMNIQHANYSRFNNVNTENGDVKFYLRHRPIGDFFFEGDLIQAALRLKLSTTTTSFLANFGLTDDLDVSVTVPIVRANLDAAVDATVLRLSTGSDPIHVFPNGTAQQTFADGGSSSGVGDVLIRAKYRFMDLEGGGVALGVDLRAPTGDSENLLGTGAAQSTFSLIASLSKGRLAPHVNLGYTISGDSDVLGELPNELGYRAGVEFVVNPSLTVTGDLVGRAMLDTHKLELGDTVYSYRNASGVTSSTTFSEFQQHTGTLHSISAAVGGKFNVTGNLLIAANLLFPMNWSGIRAKVTPVFGIEYSFDRRR